MWHHYFTPIARIFCVLLVCHTRVPYHLGVAHFSMLQALETLIFSYSLFCVLILIPPWGSLSWAPPQCGPSKYHALSGGGGASDVLPFPADSATVRGDCLLSTFCHSDWSGGSMILSADEYYWAEKGQYCDVISMEIVFLWPYCEFVCNAT